MRQLLELLKRENIHLSLQGEDLTIKFNGSQLPEPLSERIKSVKRELIQYLKNDLVGEKRYAPILSLGPGDGENGYPLSSSQRRVWMLSQFPESNVAYNMPGVYIMEGEIDQQAVEWSFGRLVARHEALRTVFREREGEVRQYVQEPSEFKLDWRDLRQYGDQEVDRMVREEMNQPFDLSNDMLLRAVVWQASEHKWVLLYVMHHIISDGWSMGILIRDLLKLYNSYRMGKREELVPLPIQYKDYAVWQQQQLTAIGMQAHKRYWLDQMSGDVPVLELRGDRPRPAVKSYKGGMVTRGLGQQLSAGLRELSQGHGATLFMTLLSVVKVLLHRYTGQEDIVIGCS